MTVGVQVWYGEEEFSIDVLLLLFSLYITQIYLLFFLSFHFTLKCIFYTKHFVLLYSIDVVSTPSYRNRRGVHRLS